MINWFEVIGKAPKNISHKKMPSQASSRLQFGCCLIPLSHYQSFNLSQFEWKRCVLYSAVSFYKYKNYIN